MRGEGGIESREGGPKPKVRVITPIEGLDTKAQMAPTSVSATTSRTCAYHPSIPAIYICANCSKPLCVGCGVPHGHLYICPQCYQPPPPMQVEPERKEPPKPSTEAILRLFGGLLIIVGFFLPWVTSEYISPGFEYDRDSVISGFTIAGDYPEVILVLIMGILILVIEFLLLILASSPTMVKRPPIGIRLLSMFLGIIAYVVLAEVVLKAESFINNIHVGWFVCVIGASITLLGGAIEISKHYRGDEE